MPTNTYVALKTTTVGTATPSVTLDLTGITGYTDLILVASIKVVGSASNTWVRLGNSSIDTGANYSWTRIMGNGSTATSARGSNTTDGVLLGDSYTTDFTADIIQIQNYSNTTTNKTVLTRNSFAPNLAHVAVGLWRSTSAINYVQVYASGVNLAVGSTFTIYGIAAASVGAKATGGTIYQDSSYFYHVFAGNGTFTPTQSISADVLVLAGGGSGGINAGGGGGAGGLQLFSSQSLTATNYTCTVGGGGTAISGTGQVVGNQGTASSFTGLSSSTGGGFGATFGTTAGGNGGSGGGGSNGGAGGTGSQGSNGGAGVASLGGYAAGGGGGGAGAVGTAGSGTRAGDGGNGTTTYSSWLSATGFGVSGFIAGGGGGAGDYRGSTTGGNAGAGGGGVGSTGLTGSVATIAAGNGLANTGSGGGGAGYLGGNTMISGAGGSGIVIVRYAK